MSIHPTSEDSKHSARTRLCTLAELEKNAIAELGSMDETSYEVFLEKMTEVAKKAGVANPKMVVGMKFNQGRGSTAEFPYLVTTQGDWNVGKTPKPDYPEKIYVIDGSKFELL